MLTWSSSTSRLFALERSLSSKMFGNECCSSSSNFFYIIIQTTQFHVLRWQRMFWMAIPNNLIHKFSLAGLKLIASAFITVFCWISHGLPTKWANWGATIIFNMTMSNSLVASPTPIWRMLTIFIKQQRIGDMLDQ